MKTKDVRGVEWLYGELPDLVSSGTITEETKSRIESHYGELAQAKPARSAVAVFAVLGSVLIGLGIILVFAFNWRELPRPARLCLACLPLCSSLGLGAYALGKRMGSTAWREGAAVFISLSLCGAFGLIGQTYHLPGGLDDLLLPWFLLSLPLAYIFDSNVVQLLYIVGIAVWTCVRQSDGGEASEFWIFLGLILPRAGMQIRKDRHSAESSASLWLLGACLSVCLGVSLEKVMPGLWIILYGSFFSCLYLADKLWFEGPERAIERPLSTMGGLGILAMAFILCYEWPWKEIGWHWLRDGDRFVKGLAWIDYLVVCSCFLISIALLALSFIKRKKRDPAFGLFPVAIGVSYALVSRSNDGGAVLAWVHIAMNAFILYAGIRTILSGLKKRRIGDVNSGAFIVSLLIALRFIFEEGFFENLAVRGVSFIALGLGFLTMNLVLTRVYKGDKP